MKRHNLPSPLTDNKEKIGRTQRKACDETVSRQKKTCRKGSSHFTIHIIPAEQAVSLSQTDISESCRKGDLAFYLQENTNPCRHKNNIDNIGFCIVRSKGAKKAETMTAEHKAAVKTETYEKTGNTVPLLHFTENIMQTHKDKNFLEIILFHIADPYKMTRAKTILLRALGDYCRSSQIDYIFGKFSFDGKYPAAYAREFSYLYHHYRLQTPPPAACSSAKITKNASMDIMPEEAVSPHKTHRFLPPLLRYCLRLGAKAVDNVAIDNHYNQGAGIMNVLLFIPFNAGQKEGTAEEKTVPK